MSNSMTADRSFSRKITLDTLKEELYSLNMWMLTAMQQHNEEAQEDIRQQMASVQAEISRMKLGYGYR